MNSIRDLVAESTVMMRLDHPNVLPLLGVCVDSDGDNLFKIILPFMANGDLRSFLKQSREDPASIDEYTTVCVLYLWDVSTVFLFRISLNLYC